MPQPPLRRAGAGPSARAPRPRPRLARGLVAALAGAAALAGCGKVPAPVEQRSPLITSAPVNPGAIALATKNTTRIGGADPVADAAAVARAIYPGLTVTTRPQAVVLVDERNWAAAIAAASLAGAPLGAPLLYARGDQLPAVSSRALLAMRPLGAGALGGAQVLRIGTRAPVPGAYRTRTIAALGTPAETAAAIARQLAGLQSGHPGQVIALREEAPPALQMPAAGLAAESATPIVFIESDGIPAATAAVLRRLGHPAIYLVGAGGTSARTLAALGRLGRVRPIGPAPSGAARASEAIDNAIAVSRFADGSFGWGIHEAGHGLAFANSGRPLDAPAAAPLSAHGDYAPLLLLDSATSVPAALAHYLSNIEPGYNAAVPPVRVAYNHGWLIGDEHAISVLAQAEVDAILEVAPRPPGSVEPLPAPE